MDSMSSWERCTVKSFGAWWREIEPVLPSSICVVRPLAISTGWMRRLKARPKTPSTSDSIRFSMCLRKPNETLTSRPRYEVPKHPIYYSGEKERSHSIGQRSRGGLRGDDERVPQHPAADRRGE